MTVVRNAPLSPRYTTKGRADPWSIPSPRRCHSRHFHGALQPMDSETSRSTLWSILAIVFAVCVFAAPFLSWSAS
jgi:hypothetical protein